MAEQRQLTALLVGHDKDSADLLGTMLESVGLNVQTALNEEQAYQMLTNNPDTLFVEPIGIRGGKPYLYPFLEDLVKKEVKKPNFIITAG